jgi:hypothetical protein
MNYFQNVKTTHFLAKCAVVTDDIVN